MAPEAPALTIRGFQPAKPFTLHTAIRAGRHATALIQLINSTLENMCYIIRIRFILIKIIIKMFVLMACSLYFVIYMKVSRILSVTHFLGISTQYYIVPV